MKIKNFIFAASAVIIAFCSCSTSPRSSGDVYYIRNQAESLLDTGNKDASQGKYENALLVLNESKRYAILADDPSLLIRCGLSLGNTLFFLDRTQEAFAEWESAIKEAVSFGNSELLAVSRVFLARGQLMSGRESAQSVFNDVNALQANIRSDRAYIAFSWQVKGLALRAMGSFNEAEAAVRRSLDIHLKDKLLENASYDWYLIGSIRSLSGNIAGALQALQTSIELDRRAENSFGLASSWRAMGDVLLKAGRPDEADDAYRRSAAIFLSMGNAQEALDAASRIRDNQ